MTTQIKNRIRAIPYVFPAAPGCVGDDIQKGVGQVALVIERVILSTHGDVTEISAKEKRGEKEKGNEKRRGCGDLHSRCLQH